MAAPSEHTKTHGVRQVLSSLDDVRAAVVEVTGLANRTLSIFTHDLEPRHLRSRRLPRDAEDASSSSRSFARVRVLIVDPTRVITTGEPVREHGAPAQQLHRVPQREDRAPTHPEAFCIADEHALMYRRGRSLGRHVGHVRAGRRATLPEQVRDDVERLRDRARAAPTSNIIALARPKLTKRSHGTGHRRHRCRRHRTRRPLPARRREMRRAPRAEPAGRAISSTVNRCSRPSRARRSRRPGTASLRPTSSASTCGARLQAPRSCASRSAAPPSLRRPPRPSTSASSACTGCHASRS